jgi:hypothetical protein
VRTLFVESVHFSHVQEPRKFGPGGCLSPKYLLNANMMVDHETLGNDDRAGLSYGVVAGHYAIGKLTTQLSSENGVLW